MFANEKVPETHSSPYHEAKKEESEESVTQGWEDAGLSNSIEKPILKSDFSPSIKKSATGGVASSSSNSDDENFHAIMKNKASTRIVSFLTEYGKDYKDLWKHGVTFLSLPF
jgi:hypothetical protein